MGTLYLMDSHEQTLDVWRRLDARALRVAHIDFHCDMRGLLVDFAAARAYAHPRGLPPLDEGNYISHGLLEGRVAAVRWVHDRPGGRLDDVNGVRLATDLSARRLVRQLRDAGAEGHAFAYAAMTIEQWAGPEADEFLDIDWDVFASVEYPAETVARRAERFLDLPFRALPAHTALCYSPGYSHEDRAAYEAFALALAKKLDARIVRLPAPAPRATARPAFKLGLPYPLYLLLRRRYFGGIRWLRYRGVY